MSNPTGSDLPDKFIERTPQQVELQGWIDSLQRYFPNVPKHFIETIATAYQLNPEKFNNIIENDIKLEAPKQDKPGTYTAMNVYTNENEIPNPEDMKDVFAAEYSAAISK